MPPTFRKGRLLTEKVANLKGPPALLSRPSAMMNRDRAEESARPIPNKQLCCYEMFTTRLLSAASCAPGGGPSNHIFPCTINFIRRWDSKYAHGVPFVGERMLTFVCRNELRTRITFTFLQIPSDLLARFIHFAPFFLVFRFLFLRSLHDRGFRNEKSRERQNEAVESRARSVALCNDTRE